jgi:CheY-like chemotaxis protein
MDQFGQRSFRVLLVDDTDDIHDILRHMLSWAPQPESDLHRLESALFEADAAPAPAPPRPTPIALPTLRVDSAFQGAEAVEMVRTASRDGDPYQLVFMDVRMPPGIDGVEATRQIWRIQPDVHVIICTAYSDHSIDEIITMLGVTDRLLFVTKPFSTAVLKQSAILMLKKWDILRELRT